MSQKTKVGNGLGSQIQTGARSMRKVYIVSYMEPLVQKYSLKEEEELPDWPGFYNWICREFNAAHRLANAMFRKNRREYIFPSELTPLDPYSRSGATRFQTREEAEAAIAKFKAEFYIAPDDFYIYSIEEVDGDAPDDERGISGAPLLNKSL
jgi:hypothetical protein